MCIHVFCYLILCRTESWSFQVSSKYDATMKCMSLLSFVHTNLIKLNRLQMPFTQHRTKQEDQKENVDHCWSTSMPPSPCRFLVPFFFVDNILSGFHFKEEARGRFGIRPKILIFALEICLANLGRKHGLIPPISGVFPGRCLCKVTGREPEPDDRWSWFEASYNWQ